MRTTVKPLYVSSMMRIELSGLCPLGHEHPLGSARDHSGCPQRQRNGRHDDQRSSPEIVSIIASTATIVIADVTNWLIVIETDDWMLSTSLVTLLNSSPRCRGAEVRQRKPVHFRLYVGPQRGDRALDDNVEQPCLHPDGKGGNQIQGQCQREGVRHGREVHAAPGRDVHSGEESANVESPRPASAIACSLVIPAGSPRPMTPLNNRSVACPRDAGADHRQCDADN